MDSKQRNRQEWRYVQYEEISAMFKEADWQGKTGADVARETLRDLPADYALPVDQKRVLNDREVTFILMTHDGTQGTQRFHDEALLIFTNLGGEWKISR
jgi:hypothetical protein